MNQRLAKKIRKYSRKYGREYLIELRNMPFRNRWGIVWWILFGDKNI